MKNTMRYLLTHFSSTFSFTSYYNFLKSSGSKIDNNEVDFLITKKGRPEQLIQVSDNIEDKKTKEREIRALVTASKKLNIKNCLILTDGQKFDIHEDGLKINVLPLWIWLLE